MRVLAIVPARGGSKGIPHKNIAMCAGKPLIQWTLDAVKDTHLVTDSMVSTDDLDISRALNDERWVSMTEGVISDDAQIEDRLDEVFKYWPDYDAFVLLQPTSPLRTGRHIDAAIEMLEHAIYGSVVSLVPSHSLIWDVYGGNVTTHYDTLRRPNRQNMNQYEENGAIYAFTRECWEKHHNRMGPNAALYLMDEEQRLQVDTPFDLWMAEQILERNLVSANR
jgi:CMP-N,N'-diacetyllegionaminic acid synthase